jgi:hypothetical protein
MRPRGGSAWESVTLLVPEEMLLANQDEASIHQRILEECKLRDSKEAVIVYGATGAYAAGNGP